MAKMKAAFIGFVDRNAGDPLHILASHAKAGYKAVESAAFFFRDVEPAEAVKKLKDLGLQALCIGAGARPGTEPPTPAELVKRCRAWEVDRVANFGGKLMAPRFGGGEMPAYDEIMQEIEKFDALAKELDKEGIRFTFHNHDIEFLQTYNGVPVFWLMAAHSEYLKFQLDCGWAAYAGEDPVRLMKLLGKRVTDIHIKDYTHGEVVNELQSGAKIVMPRFTTPGTGVLDMKGCLEAAAELGIEWAIIEQDFQYNLSINETITAAYLNMKETGLVE